MSKVLQMERRKTPADPFVRERLAAYARSARGAIRETRREFALKIRRAGRESTRQELRAKRAQAIEVVRWDYRRARAAFEAVDALPPKELKRYLAPFRAKRRSAATS